MDSSNAEKRETVAERAWREHPDEMARAHTELQVEVLREQLAAAEAVIEKVRGAWHADTGSVEFGESVRAILPVAPSEVLAEHDREVAARTLEAFDADLHEWYPEDVFPKPSAKGYRLLHEELTHADLTLDVFSADLMRRAAHLARDRAAALRSGTEGSGS